MGEKGEGRVSSRRTWGDGCHFCWWGRGSQLPTGSEGKPTMDDSISRIGIKSEYIL